MLKSFMANASMRVVLWDKFTQTKQNKIKIPNYRILVPNNSIKIKAYIRVIPQGRLITPRAGPFSSLALYHNYCRQPTL